MDEHDELLRTWAFIKDLWQLIKKYYTPPHSAEDPYWHGLIAEAGALGEKYDRDGLATRLINAFLAYIEEKYRHGKTDM